MISLARFFRSHPGWLFTLRICLFGMLMPMVAWLYVKIGKIPGRSGGGIERAVHPQLFWIIVALTIVCGLFVTVVSTIIFLKKKRLIRKDWKLLGIDARF
jgi:NhaP-type Na+/H+ or K+/H+ antiporter